ncbi:ABC transporter ATP-binding protein/permease [Candidatus Saccharibacteria bacterium]|nr:ABC transporter ATP-binding protein/permease [Candidatus Saccharibacteria bacterium]
MPPRGKGSSPGVGPGSPGSPDLDKAKNFKASLRRLLTELKPFRLAIIATIILAALSSALVIISPKLLGQMTNQVVADWLAVSQNLPGATFHYHILATLAFQILVLFIASFLCEIISGLIINKVTIRLVQNLRNDLATKINHLPVSYFDKRPYGDILSIVTNDLETIATTLQQSLQQIVASITTVVGIAIMMIIISPSLALVALLTIPVGTIVVILIAKSTQKHFRAQASELGDLNGYIEETYTGQLLIRAFTREATAITDFEQKNHRLKKSSHLAQFLSGLMMPAMQLISNFGYVATVLFGSYKALHGQVSIGDIQAFIQYVYQLGRPLSTAAQVTTVLQSTVAASERVFGFLDAPEESLDPKSPSLIKKVRGEVNFNNVNFSYTPDKPTIQDFSVKVKPGQIVAIVGPTGAGKTTLVNLLMRFYDPTSGTITIDDVDTCTMARSDVRKLFGMVLQDSWLFSGTIKENLLFGRPTATTRELARVVDSAHVDHIIESLPEGYNTKISEDSDHLASGERQLLTIARAMLADAPMLILDEATSSVDTRTEQLIQDALRTLTHGRTTFVIAHRLSTIKNADLILVVEHGNIIEQGTHAALLKQNGAYARLYNAQFAEE